MAEKVNERFLIVNADDFGYCSKRNEGIVEAFCNGVVTSVSLMVNAVSSLEAVQLARKHNIPLGLHLNLTEGRPILEGHKTLIGDSGFMRGKRGFGLALQQGIIDRSEIEGEINAQLSWFKENVGCNPSHVDGHQHVHVFRPVCDILSDIMKQWGLTKTRNPVEMSLKDCLWIDKSRMEFFESVLQGAKSTLKIYSENGVSFPQYFAGLSTMGKEMTDERLQQALLTAFTHSKNNRDMPETSLMDTCELMVHPGRASIPGQGGCGEGPDTFSCSQDREHELAILTSKTFRDFLKSQNFVLRSYDEL